MLKNLKSKYRGFSREDSQRNTGGFTIIEVMIVLAIAGLILVIVFLAVPALQRNSRNTQRKTDASNSLSALSNYISNNNGKLPTACDKVGTASGECSFLADTKLGYYDGTTAGNTKLMVFAASAITTDPTSEQMWFVTGAACTNGAAGKPAAGPSARAFVAWYGVEGSPKTQCVEG